jgi:hypothetical protein
VDTSSVVVGHDLSSGARARVYYIQTGVSSRAATLG